MMATAIKPRQDAPNMTALAAGALEASVRFSADVLGIVELAKMNFPVSQLNRTATIGQLRGYIAKMTALVEAIEGSKE